MKGDNPYEELLFGEKEIYKGLPPFKILALLLIIAIFWGALFKLFEYYDPDKKITVKEKDYKELKETVGVAEEIRETHEEEVEHISKGLDKIKEKYGTRTKERLGEQTDVPVNSSFVGGFSNGNY